MGRFPPGGYDDDYLASSISVYINCLSRLVFLTTSIISNIQYHHDCYYVFVYVICYC